MSKVVVYNSLNPRPVRGEINHLPSLTVPDEALSIPEIFQRYARGLPLDGMREPHYSDDPENDLPDPKYMDLAERQVFMEHYKAELDELRKREQDYQQAQADKKKRFQEKNITDIEPEEESGEKQEPKEPKPKKRQQAKLPLDDEQ